jgi:DNA-binding transcriptional ArsR family regulator
MLCETVCPLVKTLSRDARAKKSQPRSGVRMQPTPKGVGDPLMTLAAVVQHLQVLEKSGLVHTRKIGRVRTCRIESNGLTLAERWIADRSGKAALIAWESCWPRKIRATAPEVYSQSQIPHPVAKDATRVGNPQTPPRFQTGDAHPPRSRPVADNHHPWLRSAKFISFSSSACQIRLRIH